MRVTVVSPAELGPCEARRWAELQEGSPGGQSPFLSLAYAQVVGRHRSLTRVAVVEEDGSIVAFLPYQLGAGRFGGTIGGPMTMVDGMVGGDPTIDLRGVVRMAGLRAWGFRHAPAEHEGLRPYRYGYSYHGHAVLSVDLGGGLEAYLAGRTSLDKRVRKQGERMERQLGPVVLEWSSPSPEHLRLLFDWKVARVDPTRETLSAVAEQIVADLLTTNDDECEAMVSVLRAGDRVAAVNLYLRRHRRLSGWQVAYNHELARFSPGMVLLMGLAHEAARRGFDWIDLGYGQDAFKQGLANASYGVTSGAVWASRVEGAGRAAYRRLLYEPLMRRREERAATGRPTGGNDAVRP